MEYTFKADVGGKSLSIQAGKVAKQASGSVVVQYGDTVVLVTAVSANNERDIDFLPLSVEYQEKIYAAGRIPGNYFRREIGRPSEKKTLTARDDEPEHRPCTAGAARQLSQDCPHELDQVRGSAELAVVQSGESALVGR